MGCDIHLYVEIDSGTDEPFQNGNYISSFSDGDIYISRDYLFFDALAGVRHYQGKVCLISPRGIPKTLSHEVFKSYYQYVFDVGETYWNDNYAKREWADEWVQKGISHYRTHHLKENGWVSCPDWHSVSFLNLEEIKVVLAHKEIDINDIPREFKLVISLLESAENLYGRNRSRIVFWFDN
jgi:hypothetical protein